MELYPDLFLNQSTVEHTLFQPIIDDEIDEEYTTRIPPNDSPQSKLSHVSLVDQDW